MPRPTFLSRWFSPRHPTPDLSTVAHPTPNAPCHIARPTPPAFSHTAPLSHATPHKPVAPSEPARQFPHAVSHFPHHALSSTTRDINRTPRQEPRLNVPRPQSASPSPGIGPRDMAETLRVQSLPAQADIFRPYQPPKGVRGDGRTHLAMDSAASANPGLLGWLRQAVVEGTAFPGYPRLAELSQRAEYRHMVEVIAAEATREWITFRARGTADKKQRLADIEREFTRLNVRDVLRRMAEYDGYYGMGLLYVDTGQPRTGGGLETPLLLRPETFRKGSLRALMPIEPVWTTPDQYDTANPLSTEFYQPSRWWVQGGQLHSTRLLHFVSRPVPDLLKPAYNFGGLSLSQMARPAVENWLRTRQSVSDLLNAFSIVALSTDMSAYAQDPEGLLSRIEAFNCSPPKPARSPAPLQHCTLTQAGRWRCNPISPALPCCMPQRPRAHPI